MAIPLFSVGKDKSINVGATSTEVLPANSARLFARLTNDSDEPIYLMLGETAAMNQAIRLEKATLPNNFWEINNTNLYTGSINAICTTGGKKLLIVENTVTASTSSSSSSFSSSSSSFSSSSSSQSSSSCSSSQSSSSCSSSVSSSSCSSSFSSSSCSSSFSSSSCSSSFSSSCSSSFSSSSCSSSFSSSSCSSSYSSSSSSGSAILDLNTGYKSPTTEGAVWNNWYQAENAYIDDANYALSTKDDTQDYGTFTFGVPAYAIRITGIQVAVKGYRAQAGDTTMAVRLSWDGGTNKSTAKNVTISGGGVEATNTVGANWIDWGHTWTVDELSNANFWAGFTTSGNAGDDYRINHIQVKVYYQEQSSSSSSSSSFSSSSCSSSFSSSSCSSSFSSSSCSSSFSSSSCSSSFSSSSCSSSFSSSSSCSSA